MSTADHERSSTLPTLTWESVVTDRPTAGRAGILDNPSGRVSVPAMPPPSPILSDPDPSDLVPSDVMPPDLAAPCALTMSPLSTGDDGPSIGSPITPDAEFVLPSIREATPVEPYDSPVLGLPAALADQQDSPGALTAPAAPSDSSATTMPPVSGAIVLPAIGQVDQTARPVPPVSPLAVELPRARKPARRRRRSGLRLVVTFVLLAGVVGAAVVFGRPYLFPDEWEANAEPYAAAVEDVTGTEFAAPLVVTAEPTSTYQSRATAQLAGDWQAQVPVWRALGLASGDVTAAGLDELLTAWSPALYSTSDGQIYHDASVTGPDLEALITGSMAAAQLDQRFGWAIGQAGRTLDDAALTGAHVLSQATATQATSPFNTPIETGPTAPLAYLPAVISYEVLAPAMYAPLLAPVDPASPNPLADVATAGPGPLATDTRQLAGAPVVQEGDVVVTPPVAMDRSFWYLAFASYLDAPTAFAASESVVESSLTVTERAGTTCAYGTFSGGDMIQTSTLRAALESWVATVPADFTAGFSVAGDGDLQFVSCDPGVQFAGANRIGTARELIGWRSAEIATINGVVANGGTEADIAEARFRLGASDVGAQLAASPVGDTPEQAADAANAAVVTIVTPPAAPAPEPAG